MTDPPNPRRQGQGDIFVDPGVGQKCTGRGRQTRQISDEEGEMEHTGRGKRVQGITNRAEREVKQN